MGKASRRATRERLKQERLKAQQRAKRNKLLGVIGAAVAVVILVVGGGYLYFTSQGQSDGELAGADLPEQTLQQDGSVVLAEDGAQAPVVEVYVDFQCPACKQFENASGGKLKQLATDGEAIVHYRPVSIFAQQPAPISANSLRGGAAARAAADYGKFVQYHDILFEEQPPEGQKGFAVEDLKEWGETVGIDDPAFAERIDAESAVVEQFTGDYMQQLGSKAQSELGQEQLQEMRLNELIAWGEENGVDASFLDGTYVKQIIDATGAVHEKYPPDTPNAFEGTPSVYVNGTKLGNEAYSANGIADAVSAAEPGEVGTEPLASDGGAATSGSPSEEPSESPTKDESES